ncbi:MAG: thermonuclease family protein [Cyanobacteriota bacterium]
MLLLKRSLALFALTLAASASLSAGRAALAPPAASYPAKVLSVGDGNTLRVQAGGRLITIRLACIDAPETAQSPWGQQSRAHLMQRLPPGRQITIQPHTIDRYGRTVAEVISDINVNLVMVEDGQAFAYRRYLSGCDAKAYLEAEYRASRHRYGVWQQEGGITRPWDFRHGRTAAVIPAALLPLHNGVVLDEGEGECGRFGDQVGILAQHPLGGGVAVLPASTPITSARLASRPPSGRWHCPNRRP